MDGSVRVGKFSYINLYGVAFTGPIILIIFIVLGKLMIFQFKGSGRFICKAL